MQDPQENLLQSKILEMQMFANSNVDNIAIANRKEKICEQYSQKLTAP